MRVLLTGIAGFIGSHIVEHFQANTDWEIVGLASFRHKGDPLRTVSFRDDVRIYHADLTAPLSFRLAELIGAVDVVINAAAESHVDRSIDDPRHFIENNVSSTITMLDYARVVRPKMFIQISTDEVYGPALPGESFKEWSSIIPSNPYSSSKACQEAIAISYWRTYGVPVVITNTMNNFGERQDAEKMVPKTIASIARDEEVVVHGKKGRIGSRFYLHARNHADALMFIINEVEPLLYEEGLHGVPQRINVVGNEEVSNLVMAQTIARIMGKELKYTLQDFHTARPGHDLRYALDGSKLRGMGWKPPIPLRDSLAKTIEWTLNHPEWLR